MNSMLHYFLKKRYDVPPILFIHDSMDYPFFCFCKNGGRKDGGIHVTPPFLGVTRGYHVSWPIMENMIPTMMMIIMSTDGIPTTTSFTFTATGQPRLITFKQPRVWEMVSHHHREVYLSFHAKCFG
jgi:hypothetical protein